MNWKEHINKIVFLLIGAMVSLLFNNYSSDEANKTRFFDYKMYLSDNMISQPEDLDKKITMLVGKDTLNELKEISFEIENYSKKSYRDIPIYIELFYLSGKAVNVISTSAVGENLLPEGVTKLDKLEKSKNLNAYKVGYQIKVANDSYENYEPVFTAKFYITGEIPKYKIGVVKEGLRLRERDSSEIYKFDWLEEIFYVWFPAIVLFVVLYILFGIVAIFIVSRINVNWFDKKNERQFQHLSDIINKRESVYREILKSENSSNKMAKEYQYIRNLLIWEKNGKVINLIAGKKNPPSPPAIED